MVMERILCQENEPQKSSDSIVTMSARGIKDWVSCPALGSWMSPQKWMCSTSVICKWLANG
jgi:hypothetical protein